MSNEFGGFTFLGTTGLDGGTIFGALTSAVDVEGCAVEAM